MSDFSTEHLIAKIFRYSADLSHKEQVMLLAMASSSEQNATVYARGWSYLGMCMGWGTMDENPHTQKYVSRVIKSLVDKGYLERLHRAGFYEYQQYRFTFPGESVGAK